MGVEVKKESNLKGLSDEVIKATKVALTAIGMQAENYAKMKCPVDTGLLRNSITFAVYGEKPNIDKYQSEGTHAKTEKTEKHGTAGKSVNPIKVGTYQESVPNNELAVYLGTNVEYAPYVEMGTSKQDAQPFIKPAIENHRSEYMDLAKKYLKDIE